MQSVTHTLKKGDIEDTIIISGYDASDAMALITSLTGESVEDDYDFQDDMDEADSMINKMVNPLGYAYTIRPVGL